MPISAKIRMPLDIAMTVATLVLMGGNYFFESTAVHEILGVVLLVLWAVHITLNRRFFLSLFKGRYNVFRILQAVVNCGILLCAIFLMVSGIMLSNHVFSWLGIESGASFARNTHMLASHWYLIFVSLHIGLHLSLFIRGKVATGITFALAAYGIYAFIARGLWKYLTLQQPFFFLDLERGYLLFTLDYIAIMALFAVAMHLAMTAMVKYSR
ncbi:DUF4405 domain-containing protein [Fibrobacter succinogenes]|uniref:DUF4405 domain-containing protein n=1 Tax=Fibrobacter succinogenes TaxID=833 RepID=UPI00156959A4|nr:DUF4405 domain-containing protein [Fibrobacter succinogenes]